MLFAVVFVLVATTAQWHAIHRSDENYARGASSSQLIDYIEQGRPNLFRWRARMGSGMTFDYEEPYAHEQAWRYLVQYALAPTLLTQGDSADQVLVACPSVAGCMEYEQAHHVKPLVTVIPEIRLYPRVED